MDGRPPGLVDFGLILGKDVSEPLFLTKLMEVAFPDMLILP